MSSYKIIKRRAFVKTTAVTAAASAIGMALPGELKDKC
ncbi:MAG: twin-arginine translocation signal domain-containing protein [Bacteroidales bacterium]|nr:twin-arginine translocation signal domain-containing protein [Bacteroidales bacterium]